jgi:DNA-binding transcriptional LysR family regulator
VDTYFRRLGLKPNIILELNHPEGIKRAVRNNSLATITHRVAVQEDLEAGTLSELEPPLPLPTLTYKVVHTRAKPTEHVRAFSRLLRERLGTK